MSTTAKGMARKTWLISGFVLLATVIVGCGEGAPSVDEGTTPAIDTTASETTTSRSLGEELGLEKLIAGADATFRPNSFVEDDEFVGIDPEIATEIAARLGVPLDYRNVAFEGIIPALEAHQLDILAQNLITAERQEVISYTQPILAVAITTVVSSEQPDSFNPGRDSLEGLSVGVQIDTGAARAVEALHDGSFEIVVYNTAPDEYQDLILGRIDVVAIETTNAGYNAEYVYPGELRVTGESLTDDLLYTGVAVAMDRPELLAAVDQIVGDMLADGSMDAIMEKWLGEDVNYRLGLED